MLLSTSGKDWRKLKAYNLKPTPFPVLRRKKWEMPNLEQKMEITDQLQSCMFLFPEPGVGFMLTQSFCPSAVSAYMHISPSSLSICFYSLKHLFLSLLTTSEFQVPSKLMGLFANKVSGNDTAFHIENFLCNHINQIFSTSVAQSKVSGYVKWIIIDPWWNCASGNFQ